MQRQLATAETALAPVSVVATPGTQLIFGAGVFNTGDTANFSLKTAVYDEQGVLRSFVLDTPPFFQASSSSPATTLLVLTIPEDAVGTFLLEVEFCSNTDCSATYGAKKKAFITVA